MKPRFRSLIAAFAPLSRSSLIVCASLCAATSAQAASGTWTSLTSGGNWSDIANWNSGAGPVADGSGFTADFSTVNLPAGAFTVNLLADRSIGNITFGDTDAVNTAGTWALAGTSTLTLEATTPTITTGVDATVAPIVAGTAGLTKAGAAKLTLSNANTFTGAVNVTGGNLTLSNTNAYAGGTTIASSATLVLGMNANYGTGGIGTGTVVFTGGTLTHGYNTSNTLVYANAMSVASGQTGTLTTPNRFRLNGAISGAGTLNMSINTSASRADFQNDFSGFSGELNLTGSGTIRLGIVALGSGQPSFPAAGWANTTLSLDGATITPTTNSYGNTISIGALTSTGATGTLGGGTAGAANYSIGNLYNDTTFAGGITGNAALTITGGTLTLTNTTALTYTGATTVSAGSLKMNGTKSGTGTTTVNGYAILAGTGSVAGTTTVQANGTLSPGDDLVSSGIGNITFSSLTLASNSVLSLEFGTGNDKATVSSGGTLTLQSGINVDVNGFNADGPYTIIDHTGATVSGSVSTSFTAINGDSGKVYTFTDTGSLIQMTISSSDPSNYWNVDGGGSWNTAGNWTKITVPNAAGAIAKIGPGQGGLGGNFSTDPDITLDANQTVGVLSLNDDFGPITIDPGTSAPGTLFLDNGALTAEIVDVAGFHIINAPVSVDAQGVAVDIGSTGATPYSLTINGVLSGSGAELNKTGSGNLILTGNNTYDGGTILGAGTININSATSLGATTAAATFSGGTLQLASPLTGITRSYQITGANSAIIDTNANDFSYDGVISPVSGATGGLTKNGAGTLTLSAAQTYTGTTLVNGGIIKLSTGSSISGGVLGVAGNGGGQMVVDGGSFTSSVSSYVGNGTQGLLVSGGSASFNAGLTSNDNTSSGRLIAVTGGTFNASSLTMGRGAQILTTEPASASTTNGFYVNGGTAHITGALNIGYNTTSVQSSVTARIDSGSLTVDGTTLIGLNNGGRWSAFDVNGGAFTSTDAVNGILIGNNYAGNADFLVRGGTATVERISLQQIASSTSTSLLNLTGGSLYVGSGGILGTVNGGTGVLTVRLGAGTLGAKADWSSSLAMTVNGVTIKSADASDVAHNISLTGVLDGAGDLTKTGAGVLALSGTNTYTGATNVTAGTLQVNGDNSAATGAVTVSASATLGGTGTVGGAVTVNGIVAPGTSTGTLAVASATFNAGSELDVEMNDAAAPTSDKLVVTGALDITNAKLKLLPTETLAGSAYVIAHYGSLNGTAFATVEGLPAGASINYHYNDGADSNNIAVTVSASAYASWASAKGLAVGTNDGATQDPDNDGVSNVLEFALGGNPLASSTSVLPALTANATNFVFNFTRNPASESEVALTFGYGSNLTGWTPVTVGAASSGPDANGVTVTVVSGSPDSVTVTVPRALAVSGKLFGRLQAVK